MHDPLSRLYRRVQLAVGIGRTTASPNDGGPIQTAQVRMQPDNAVRDATKMMQMYGFSSAPPIGTDVVVVFLGGDRSNGVVVAHGSQGARRKGLSPSEVSVHALGMDIHLSVAGLVINAGGLPVTITNGTKARFEMPIESTGEVTANADGAAVLLSQHTHPDPQGGNTSLPVG